MMILQLQYTGQHARVLHLLYLGDRSEKICGIEIEKFNKKEKQIVLDKLKDLNEMDLSKLIIWFKTHCPIALKTGYKEIYKKNTKIIAKMPINIK